jgi:hypothetical protein
MRENLLFAGVGWVTGVLLALVVAFVIFPAFDGSWRGAFAATNLLILGLVLLVVSPAALAGGFAGSRIPREGGRSVQLIMAAICGVLLAMPLSCVLLWYTGW